MSNGMNAPLISRRHALRGGALVVAFSLAAPRGADGAGTSQKPALRPPELDSWIAVRPDISVIGYFGKVDVGLGIQVAIAQIIADELDVAFNQVQVVMGDTDHTINQGGASGSTGLELGGLALRNAAAQARAVLLGLAAQVLGVPAGQLNVANGVVTAPTGGSTDYGKLIGGRYFDYQLGWNGKIGNELTVTGTAAPKAHGQYRVVGTSVPRADIADKLFGQEIYITDLRVPGMLHGRVIRPPAVGAVPVQVDASSVAHLYGVSVVHVQDFLGVVAPKEWASVRAARQLKVQWSSAPPVFPPQAALYNQMKTATSSGSGGKPALGDADGAFSAAARHVQGRYEWPFQSHASMGPACAVADVHTDHATIWTADQKPHYIRDGVAALLGLPAAQVHGIWLRGPGSYGRNDGGDCAMDAAVLSRAVGLPVRLQYMRADATAWDPKGPASVHDVTAALDAAGDVTALRYHSTAFSRENIASHPDDPSQSLAGQNLGMNVSTKAAFDVPEEGYAFPAQLLDWSVVPALAARASPLRSSHLRDPLGPQINFASESFIDELADEIAADPIAFRLKYLKDQRGAAVIEAAAKLANWSHRPAPSSPPAGAVLTGVGIAYARRKATRVAVITTVQVDRATGRIHPVSWAVAHDCGLIVNPNNLRLVIEGNIIHATSRALYEEVMFSSSMVTSHDWVTYPILLAKDAPRRIDISLINHPEDMPRGAGEPATRPVAAAIGNAVFNATGIRLRRAPLTAARMQAAFAKVLRT
jgi:nicotinate dehydrogenase subunit B